MIDLLEYIWLGFLITALPGAVFFETVRRQLHDRQSVLSFLCGNFAGVLAIATLAPVGITLVTDLISQDIFYLLSGGLLVYIGASTLTTSHQTSSTATLKGRSFITGMTLSLANPVSVVFWITMVGSFYAQSTGWLMPAVSSLAVIFGAILFFVLLLSLLSRFGNFLKPKHTLLLARVFGFIILLYGLSYIFKYF